MTAATRCAARSRRSARSPRCPVRQGCGRVPAAGGARPRPRVPGEQFAPAIGAKRFRSRPPPRRPSRIPANRRGAVHVWRPAAIRQWRQTRPIGAGNRDRPPADPQSPRRHRFRRRRRQAAGDRIPYPLERRAARRPLPFRPVRFAACHRRQVQALPRPCCADVQQAPELGRFLRGIEPAEPRVHGIGSACAPKRARIGASTSVDAPRVRALSNAEAAGRRCPCRGPDREGSRRRTATPWRGAAS